MPLNQTSKYSEKRRNWCLAVTSAITPIVLSLSYSLAAVAVFVPPDRGLPGQRRGGGTRSGGNECVSADRPKLTAVLPRSNLGLTTAAYPRFFWYSPSTQIQTAEFQLYQIEDVADFTATETLIFSSQFQTGGQVGIASFTLPQGAGLPALERDRPYYWELTLICHENRNQDATVSGWVERVDLEPTIANRLQQLQADPELANQPPVQQQAIEILGASGLWIDTLDSMMQLRCQAAVPSFAETQWQDFLVAVDLEAIATEPLLCPPS